MNNSLFFVYYISILLATIVGLAKYRYIDVASRAIVILLVVTLISELSCYIIYTYGDYPLRSAIYHFYNIIQAILISAYYISAIKPYHHRKLLITNVILWTFSGILNVVFLQPLGALNTNILMLESLSFITMSLYFIYRLLKNDRAVSIFQYPHFWLSVIWLIFWSSLIFFWAFIKILYSKHWEHMHTAVYVQVIIGMLTYLGIGTTLFFYPKKQKS